MTSRRIEVFFYGLFMDADLLRAKGADPLNIRPACVRGFALRIGERATLLRASGATVYGIVMELMHAELDQLYSNPSVRAYRPEAVIAELAVSLVPMQGSAITKAIGHLLAPRYAVLRKDSRAAAVKCWPMATTIEKISVTFRIWNMKASVQFYRDVADADPYRIFPPKIASDSQERRGNGLVAGWEAFLLHSHVDQWL